MKTVGIILIVAGVILMIIKGFSYSKQQKRFANDPVGETAIDKTSKGWPVYAGEVAVLAGGIVLLAHNRKQKRA